MKTTHGKNWVEISTDSLRSNAKVLKRHVGPSQLMAVVKANAYGHGLSETVSVLKGHVDWFGVDSISEAILVRSSGAMEPLLILGHLLDDELPYAIRSGFSFVVYDISRLRKCNKIGTKKRPAKVHLKIETGTSRQGVSLGDLPKIMREIKTLKNVVIEGVSTHYANIEDTTDHSYADGQLRKFREALDVIAKFGFRPPICHTAASAASLLYPETRFNMVRAGIALYGHWPSHETEMLMSGKLRLKPALTWKSTVAQVKDLLAGTPVSYGLTEKVSRDSSVAVVATGYYDGFPRNLSSVGAVLIRGQRAKVLGRVCMNMIVVDVTNIKGAKAGDEVVIIGKQRHDLITAEEIAELGKTINYEILSRINPFLPRVIV